MKQLRLLGLPILLLALAFSGCGGDDGGGSSDTWSAIKSLDQTNGTWKGSLSVTQPIKEWVGSQGQAWTSEMEQRFGNMRTRTDLEVIAVISSSAETLLGTQIVTIAFSGGNINDMWDSIKKGFYGSEMRVNDEKHSVSFTQDHAEFVTVSSFSNCQINQNGKKLRFPSSNFGMAYMGDYLVLEKQ